MKTEDTKPVKPTPRQLRKIARERFLRSRRAGSAFTRQLQKLGLNIGKLVEKHAPGGELSSWRELKKALSDYADQIKPWAEALATKMHSEVEQRDAQAWYQASRELGQHLRKEIASAPVGRTMRALPARAFQRRGDGLRSEWIQGHQ
jgi:hypothetical protein